MHDLRYALRILSKRPLATAIAILCLAVGIGCNAAVFSVVHTVLIEPLPFPSPQKLVVLWDTNQAQQQTESPLSAANIADVRDGNTVFEDLTAWYYNSYTLTGVESPQELTAVTVTASFFRVLGAEAQLGRTFVEGEDKPEQCCSAVLSHGLWQRRFAGQEGILGETISLDQAPFKVVGVMPPGFDLPGDTAQLWVAVPLNTRANRAVRFLQVFARLKPAASMAQAQANLDDLAAQLEAGFPASNRGWRMRMVPLQEQRVGSTRTPLLLLLAAVGAILLLACVNVAILLLARAGTRVREVAVRTALGASPKQLLRQLLTESVVLSLLGGAAGILLAFLMLPLLRSLAPASIPRLDEASIDGLVLVFTLGVSVLCGLLFGSAPALEALRFHPGQSLQESSGRDSSGLRGARLRAVLVIAEVSLAVLLLVGAGLLMHSFQRLRSVDPGFRTEGILVARIFLDQAAYPTPASRIQYYQQLLTRLRALPGAEAAGAVTALPMSPISINYDLPYRIPGRLQPLAGEEPQADFRVSTPGYHETMGIRLLAGRLFDERDRGDSQPVVIINQAMADLAWPGGDPLGQQLQIPYNNWASRQVVGVVSNNLYYGLARRPKPEMFLPHSQVSMGGLHVAVRVAGLAAQQLAPAVRRSVAELDPSQPVHSLTTIEDLLAADLASERFLLTLLASLSLAALLLSAAGIYGIVSHSVTARTREFGIRLALGSSSSGLRRMVLAETFVQIAAGMALGLVGAALGASLLESLLFETSRLDPATYAGVPIFLGLTALLAVYLPARQASSLDPVEALRRE